MTLGRKTGGRVKGTPNKATARIREKMIHQGQSMLAILVENVRELQALCRKLADNPTDENIRAVQTLIGARGVLAAAADRAAKYLHAPQMAIKHSHVTENGEPIRPVVVISGYPGQLPASSQAPPVIEDSETKH
jgi:hypothetical protein